MNENDEYWVPNDKYICLLAEKSLAQSNKT